MKAEAYTLRTKAYRTLEAARRDLDAGDADNAVARAYYAAYHIATALLHEHNLTARSHAGTQRLFFEHFVKRGPLERTQSSFFSSLYQMRQEADYAFGEVFETTQAAEAVRDAVTFVEILALMLPTDDADPTTN